ncbi:hypothetical protein ACFQNE_07140 [Gordonia phosphorivorans]|uniref:Uncharacterized protein n=1 Tax=Gordonia phosphorivorans TaxID=1056982 RepID=A0ABV6H6V0_9ACTN
MTRSNLDLRPERPNHVPVRRPDRRRQDRTRTGIARVVCRSTTADFADAVIVMTSNLGVREAQSKAVDFGEVNAATRSRTLAQDALKKAVPPALLNRIDAIAQFEPLTPDAITEIAEIEVVAAHGTFSEY